MFDSLACDSSSRRALSALVAQPPNGSLVVIHGPGDIAAQAAFSVANSMVRPAARSLDVRVARSEGDRWTVAEVSEQVIAPSMLRPIDRTVIVVERADSMDQAAAEHLLKIVEDPPQGCLFMFAVQNIDALLATLRSRTSAEVAVRLAPVRERAAVLAEGTGISVVQAKQIVELCGDLSSLAELVAATPDAVGALEVFNASLFSKTPTATAVECAMKLEQLAQLGDPFVRNAGASRNEQLVRSRTRTLVRHLFASWEKQVAEILRRDRLGVDDYAACTRAATALEIAAGQVGRYAPVRTTLVMLLAETAQR